MTASEAALAAAIAAAEAAGATGPDTVTAVYRERGRLVLAARYADVLRVQPQWWLTGLRKLSGLDAEIVRPDDWATYREGAGGQGGTLVFYTPDYFEDHFRPIDPANPDQRNHAVNTLRAATSDQQRALILLRLPDALVLDQQAGLDAACWLDGFEAGRGFIAARIGAMHANRDDAGTLPERIGSTLIAQRNVLRAIASGELTLPTPAGRIAAQ